MAVAVGVWVMAVAAGCGGNGGCSFCVVQLPCLSFVCWVRWYTVYKIGEACVVQV